MSQRKAKANSNKKKYEVVLIKGKSARALERAQKKAALKSKLESPLGKMRSRQERKAMAKSLKIPFTARYNGVVIEKVYKLIPAKNEKYTKLILETK